MQMKLSGILGVVVAFALAGCGGGGGGGGDDRVEKTLACTIDVLAVCTSVTGKVSASDESEYKAQCERMNGTFSAACDTTGWVAKCEGTASGRAAVNYYFEMAPSLLETNRQACLNAGGTWTPNAG